MNKLILRTRNRGYNKETNTENKEQRLQYKETNIENKKEATIYTK